MPSDKPVKKQFDKALYAANDKLAKDIALDFLLKTKTYKEEIPIHEQAEAYKKYDFVLKHKDGTIKKIEVERKLVWKQSGTWETKWDTIDVPYRKSKSEADLFIMVNNACDTIAVIDMKRILEAETKFKATTYTQREKFFAIPYETFLFFHKIEGKWKKVKHQ